MKKIEIYDPAMCCSTGVCGTSVDSNLLQFAKDVVWLKDQGVSVRRFNLAQEPLAFVQNFLVCDTLQTRGNDCLPLVLVDGAIATCSIYPTREQLAALVGLSTKECGKDGEECGDPGDDKKQGCCGDENADSSCCS